MGKRYKRYIIIMLIIIAVLNIIAWSSKSVCDWYIKNIFVIWLNIFGRITNVFPFSVGEILVYIGILLSILAVGSSVAFIFLRKKLKYKQVYCKYMKVFVVIFLNVCLVMTLNCTMLYHCTRIDPNKEQDNREYTIDELEKLYIYVVEQCNYYSARMERDEDGYVIYDKDINREAADSLRALSNDYPRLSGYYPRVKKLASSKLLSQAYIAGYFFPFSMEANVNSIMYIMNNPATYCHELSHLHGYIYEDEANFFGFLACIESEDEFFKYSGFLSVRSYIAEAYKETLSMLSEDEVSYRLSKLPKLNSNVKKDDIFLKPETWKKVEQSAVINTQTVNQISGNMMEASLQLNGVSEGIAAYDGVVELLLQYYDGILY